MFEQNPVLGPGTGTTTTHTLEILLMLAGAFLLGLWLGWLLWNRFKAAYDQLMAEHESVKLNLETTATELEAVKKRLAQSDADHATYRARIDSLTADYHDSEARFQQLNLRLSQVSEKAASLEHDLATFQPAEIPMEVIESPVDVHVESLVEELAPAEAEALVVEVPEVALPVIDAVEIEAPDVELPSVEAPKIELPAVEPVAIAPISISEPIGKKTYTGTPVIIERVTVHQSYDPSEKGAEETVPVAEEEVATAIEKVEEAPIAAPVFSFTPAASADDLRIIEGIGPKIEQVLNEKGISTFRQLAETSEERLREILVGAGNRYKMHDPSTWPEQARLADLGDWESLKSWQEQLKGGRETGNFEGPAETNVDAQLAENQAVAAEFEAEKSSNGVYAEPKIIPDSALPPSEPEAARADDLKVVEGIGPKIEELLVKNGISTYSALAATPVAQLKEILESAGSRYAIHDPGTWPAQGLLASNGEWDNLKAYQGFLNAGKRPE